MVLICAYPVAIEGIRFVCPTHGNTPAVRRGEPRRYVCATEVTAPLARCGECRAALLDSEEWFFDTKENRMIHKECKRSGWRS